MWTVRRTRNTQIFAPDTTYAIHRFVGFSANFKEICVERLSSVCFNVDLTTNYARKWIGSKEYTNTAHIFAQQSHNKKYICPANIFVAFKTQLSTHKFIDLDMP